MHAADRYRLSPEVARFVVSPDELGPIQPRQRPRSSDEVIGQPRAIEALKMAVAIRAKGYNVFVAGLSGTGKRSTVMRFLKSQSFDHARLRDIVVVENFKQQDQPTVLYFSPGDGRRFRRRMEDLITTLGDAMAPALDKGSYRERRDSVMLRAEQSETEALSVFEKELNAAGFTAIQVGDGADLRSDIGLLTDEKPASMDDLDQLVEAGVLNDQEARQRRQQYYRFMDDMNRIFLGLRAERAAAEAELLEIQRQVLRPLIAEQITKIGDEFVGSKISAHMTRLESDLVENISVFLPDDPEKEEDRLARLARYAVNVLVDHAETEKTPVIFESRPDYQKLFGSQEQNLEGEAKPGFLGLRAGSLLQASGGYLVLRAEDVLTQEDVWHSLKRSIQDESTEIRPPSMPFGPQLQSVKPEPIHLDVKIIMMGSEHLYDLIAYQDDEFGKLFKVLSEFDSVMDNTISARQAYVEFMHMIVTEEGLLPADPDGMAAVVEYGARIGEFRDKLSTRFSLIADLLREASHWARRGDKSSVDRAAVEQARAKRRFLHNLPEEKYDEQISSGEMILQVDGSRVGAINGLSVLDRGYYSFGRPMLITARVAPGTDGITNIERESGLSGELHDKGVYIIQGFLQATYAHDFPLALNASVGFEQSYVEVDGDSASSTEVYVLLSAIGDIPLRQDIAVTGSVNQFGQIQPVGGISEKIEGFFATCSVIGLTGNQGVIIPRTNIQNLILSRDVQDAVEGGRFHIYAISTIDEGIEILTGMDAGLAGKDGHFPKNSVNGIVEQRLRRMANQVKEFS